MSMKSESVRPALSATLAHVSPSSQMYSVAQGTGSIGAVLANSRGFARAGTAARAASA